MNALDRAKRLQGALGKIAERRERLVEKANGEFRLDLLSVIDSVDDETVGLVLRGLAIDRTQEYLQLALSMALDERNHSRRPASTRRSGGTPPLPLDPHEAETDAPPPALSSEDLGDEDDLTGLDTPLPPPPATPRLLGTPAQALELYGAGTDAGEAAASLLRYPEPGEPAITLPDGTVVAAQP